jgi:hypothetical protein
MTAFSEMQNGPSPRTKPNRFLQLSRIIPLFAPVLGVYALLMVSGLDLNVFHLPKFALISGATLSVSGNELFLMGVVFLLFFEIIKASNATQNTVFIEHILSTLTFVGFVVMFLTVPACGNATFLILTLMSLVDVLAGWTITYRTALRDWAVER